MKLLATVLIFVFFLKNSTALMCNGCEISNDTEACNFSYKCPKEAYSCETLVSKVEGKYSIILSCATMEKCQMNGSDQGLQKCDHSK